MHLMKQFKLLYAFLILFLSFTTLKASDTTHVYVVEIKDQIAAPSWRTLQEAIAEFKQLNADIFFVDLDTYGGQVDMADSMRTALLRMTKPVFVLINNNAASAGALISIACDSIYMHPGSTIGAATVVNQEGQAVPDKYQSYMRSKMRATAEETGRNPDISEAMVDPDKVVEGISDSGKVLTFTTSEAILNGYCQAEVTSIQEALIQAGITNYIETRYIPSTADKMIAWLINPAVSGIIILVIIGGLYFEMQSPGIGFPLAASISAAILFFAPYYLEGLAANWEIALFIVGLLLLAVEVFALPGFGIAGAGGFVLMSAALITSMLENDGLDFSFVGMDKILLSTSVVVVAMAIGVFVVLFSAAKILNSGMGQNIVLNETLENQKTRKTYESLNLLEGIANTDLRPSGKISIDATIYDGLAKNGYIEKGSRIKVVAEESGKYIVEEIEA